MMLSLNACQGALLSQVSVKWDYVCSIFHTQHLPVTIPSLLTEYLIGDLQTPRSYSRSKKVSLIAGSLLKAADEEVPFVSQEMHLPFKSLSISITNSMPSPLNVLTQIGSGRV